MGLQRLLELGLKGGWHGVLYSEEEGVGRKLRICSR